MPVLDGGGRRLARHRLKFRKLPGLYGIVRLGPEVPVPNWATKGDFSSITRTADELSIVCPAGNLPDGVRSQHRWMCLKLEGPFPFSQTGVLLSFIEPLSTNGVPIFAVSTHDTDYVFARDDKSKAALDLLREAGHTLLQSTK
jgi:uncharacterized protein